MGGGAEFLPMQCWVGSRGGTDRQEEVGGSHKGGPGQESGVGYSDRGPEGDPACHQFELSKKAMAGGRQGLRSIFRSGSSTQCNTSNLVNRPLST